MSSTASSHPSSSKPDRSGLNAVRAAFLDYFQSHGHDVAASAPLVPQDDPTLLFVNAGMAPFKNIFTGVEPPFAPRAATSQKCVRAGGKHNDLDNVGYTARHHTFFEMLGNFSFGDYFKEEAIVHAWRLVRDVFDLPEDKLLVTVYAEDDDAAQLWKKIAGLPEDKIIRIATSDNFWSMGDTGPCGPCSEIFYDHGDAIPGGPPGSPDEDGDRFIEIWNLVFMQYNQPGDGTRVALPKPSIDTGMGLERMAAVLQGVHNNYETDLFLALIAAEEEVYGAKASGDALASFRVIADHLRASAFLIADGVTPDNDGRGYVLRRIMRRAMRHGHMLGAREPLMHRLTAALVDQMGEAYPELVRAAPAIENTLEQEEARFQRTLGRGLALLDDATTQLNAGDALPGATAFKLYDTYGFPLDLTQDVLRAQGLSVDETGFDAAMAQQRARAQASWQGSGDAGGDELWFKLRETLGGSAFLGYATGAADGVLKAVIVDGAPADAVTAGCAAELVFDQTPFYGESGGQSGDKGQITFADGGVFVVHDVQKRAGDLVAHIGEMREGQAAIGDGARLVIDDARRAGLRANHSATHLLHAALRNTLGAHVTQKGSLVETDKLRFDFSHGAPVTRAEIDAIEVEVNAIIRQNAEVETREMAPEAAVAAGALALFGEKYGDTVRVLSMGDAFADDKPYSVELCGGTHVTRTGDIGAFAIMSEAGVSAGVRRIEAATGADALAYLKSRGDVAQDIADTFKSPLHDAPARVAALIEQRKSLEAQLSDAKRKLAMAGSGGPAASGPEDINGVKLIARVADGVPPKDLRGLIDQGKTDAGSGVVAFVAVNEGKAAVAIGVTDDLTDRFSAVDLVRAAAAAVGGKGGGGRPDMAQAGGPDGANAEAALDAVREALKAG